MRYQLLREFKSPSIEQTKSSAGSFERRMNSLTRDAVFDLQGDFLKMRPMKTGGGKDAVKNSLLRSIELYAMQMVRFPYDPY
jgi:hypothetical protein